MELTVRFARQTERSGAVRRKRAGVYLSSLSAAEFRANEVDALPQL